MSVKHVPPQRRVHAMIYTPAGWISGDFVLPKLHGFVDFLNASAGFVKLVNVRFTRTGQEVTFLAIQRDSITLVLPSGDTGVIHARRALGRMTSEDVSCIFDRGMVHGTLEIVDRTRVSDFLMQNVNFFPLTDATVAFGSFADVPPRIVPVAVVNARQMLAISHPRLDAAEKPAVQAG